MRQSENMKAEIRACGKREARQHKAQARKDALAQCAAACSFITRTHADLCRKIVFNPADWQDFPQQAHCVAYLAVEALTRAERMP